MGYLQFKKVWLSLVDVRAELRSRHEKFNRFLPNSMLTKKLEALVNLEEKQEAKTLLEAANAINDERLTRERRYLVDEALLLSRVVLAEALDAAGQVYLFGKGPSDCFDGEPMQPDFADFMEFEVVKELWKERVRPDAISTSRILNEPAHAETSRPETDESSTKTNAGEESAKASVSSSSKPLQPQSRSRIAVVGAARAFASRQVSLTTAFLWAKRVRSVACGSAVAYAVTDSGELFCWGGKQRAWRYFYDQSTLDSNGTTGYVVEHPSSKSGGERSPLAKDPGRPLTTRSEMLKLSLPSQAAKHRSEYDQSPLRTKYRKTFVKPERILPTEDDERARLLLIGRYYDLAPPATPAAPATSSPSSQSPSSASLAPAPVPPASTPPKAPSLQELRETVEPELNIDDLALSLQMRGVYLAKQTRTELIVKLGDCLALEIECIGDIFHDHMKEQDKVARRLRHARRENAMLEVAAKTAALWHELSQLQANILAAESEAFVRDQQDYLDMKRKIVAAKQKARRQAREGIDEQPHEQLHANGLTARGSPLQDFNGHQAVECIAVGSRHALAVHQSGKLLTWGVGTFGRLGGAHDSSSSPQRERGQNDPAAWHSDVHTPEVVDALKTHRFRAVACGFGHSLALTSHGQVFAWGSATHGKLGIGAVGAAESFTLVPMPLLLPSGVVVRKIACGPSHSAVLSVDGHLFVWGCGDGGKLGLGDGRDVGQDLVPRNGGKLGVLSTPTQVLDPFANEKLVDVSCGAGHTVVLTAAVKRAGSSDGKLVGGRVFVAGSSHALAKFTPTFAPLEIVNNTSEAVPMAKVSCGNAHTALVSADGELFTWGSNVGGCTGHSILVPRIKTPTRVSCMYQSPANLCLVDGVHAVQSTQNASCFPDYALRSSLGEYAQTQQEMCPFWQVTLLRMSRIERVRVVVWSATAGRSNDTTARAPLTKRPMSSSGTRLKYAILVSEVPFETEERGKYSLAVAKRHSTHEAIHLDSTVQTEWIWTLPVDTFGQHVRVQLDNVSGMLSLRAVEVVGMDSTEFKGPKVSDVTCGEAVTAVICRPLGSTEMLRERFLRAVRADRASLWVLQQLETFHPFLQDELAVGGHRGKKPCVLCRPSETCVMCLVEQAILEDGKVDAAKLFAAKDSNDVTASSTGGAHGAAAVTAALERKRENEEKQREAMRTLTLEELCHKLLAMNMRTEEEEAAQQQQLEQDLLDMNAFAIADKQQQQSDHAVSQGTVGRTGGSRGGGSSSSFLTKLRRALGLKSAVANQRVLTAE